MKRLIVFGPSSSYGMGLEDPKNEVWGGVLSNKLNRNFINNSVPAASNKLISYKITSFDYQPDDIVFIMWSFPDRYTILKSDKKFINLMATSEEDDIILYYKNFHEDFDHEFMSKVYINYSLDYLRKKNIKVFSLFHAEFLNKSLDEVDTLIPIYYDRFDNGYSRSSDGVHLGIEGNRDFGNTLYRYVTNISESTQQFI